VLGSCAKLALAVLPEFALTIVLRTSDGKPQTTGCAR